MTSGNMRMTGESDTGPARQKRRRHGQLRSGGKSDCRQELKGAPAARPRDHGQQRAPVQQPSGRRGPDQANKDFDLLMLPTRPMASEPCPLHDATALGLFRPLAPWRGTAQRVPDAAAVRCPLTSSAVPETRSFGLLPTPSVAESMSGPISSGSRHRCGGHSSRAVFDCDCDNDCDADSDTDPGGFSLVRCKADGTDPGLRANTPGLSEGSHKRLDQLGLEGFQAGVGLVQLRELLFQRPEQRPFFEAVLDHDEKLVIVHGFSTY